MWHSIRSKLLFWFLLVSVVPIILLSLVSYNIASDLITKEVYNGIGAIADGKAEAVEVTVRNIRATVGNFSRSPALIEAVNTLQTPNQSQRIARYQEYFRSVLENFGYASLLLTDAQGKLLFTSDPQISQIQAVPELEQVVNRSATLIEPSISDFTKSENDLRFYVAAPILETDNAMVGVLIVGFSNQNLQVITANYTGLGLTGETLLFANVDGQLNLINALRHPQGHDLPTVERLLADYSLITQTVRGANGLVITGDYRQRQVLLAREYLPSLNGGLIVKIDTAEALASLYQLTVLAIAISGALAILILVLVVNLAQSIAQPLIDLTAITRNILTGEFSWEVPIYTQDEIGQLAHSFNDMLDRLYRSLKELETINQELENRVDERTKALQFANAEIRLLNDRLKQENLRMSSELEITRRLQQLILPKDHELTSISDLEIAGFMQPATEVGGDYYDVIKSDGIIQIGVGDITGHGLESGILMIMLQTAIRTLAYTQEKDPVRFMSILNRVIYDNIQRMNADKSMSLLLLEYDNDRLRLFGQHEEAIIVHTDGTVECIDTINLGFPLGLESDISDFVREHSTKLITGDVLVLYTDGITEAENCQREFYGKERLCQVVQRNVHLSAQGIREQIIADLLGHIDTHTVFDDITLVVAKKK